MDCEEERRRTLPIRISKILKIILDFNKTQVINICNFNISSVPGKIKEMKQLKSLTMKKCQLKSINFIKHFPLIESLNFEENLIERLPIKIKLDYLESLFLNKNKIKKITSNLNCESLEEIDLSENKLETVKFSLNFLPLLRDFKVKKNKSLKFIEIGRNKIKKSQFNGFLFFKNEQLLQLSKEKALSEKTEATSHQGRK